MNSLKDTTLTIGSRTKTPTNFSSKPPVPPIRRSIRDDDLDSDDDEVNAAGRSPRFIRRTSSYVKDDLPSDCVSNPRRHQCRWFVC